MRRLPGRVWKLPLGEDDEAADREGVGRILALSDGVFAIATWRSGSSPVTTRCCCG